MLTFQSLMDLQGLTVWQPLAYTTPGWSSLLRIYFHDCKTETLRLDTPDLELLG